MMIDNCLKTNPADISEGFNAYFSSIAEKLLPKHTDGTKHFSEYLSDRVNHNFIILNLLMLLRSLALLIPLIPIKEQALIASQETF